MRVLSSLFVLVISLSYSIAGVTTIYPFPRSMQQGQNYRVWADGQEVNIWRADANADIANFAFTGSVKVKVRFKSNFTTAKIYPLKYGIVVTKTSANEAEFVLNDFQKSKIILRVNDDIKTDLFVFGDPPLEPIPSGATVYEAGVHYFSDSTITINSNQTLYLKPGAVLRGRVVIPNNSTNIKVLGRGVIVATFHGRYIHNFRINNNCSNITIDGIILTNNGFPDYTPNEGYFLDVHQLVIRGYNTKNVIVNNFKTIADFFTSDGMAFSGCQDVTVTDCFIVSSDNAIVPGWDGITKNIKLYRTVLHQMRAVYTSAIFPQGANNTNVVSEIQDFHIKDLYISQTMGKLLGCNFGNSFNKITNFVIENVYMDRLHIYDDPKDAWAITKYKATEFIGLTKSPSISAEITLKNVHWLEDKSSEGEVTTGWNLTYNCVYYNNKLITKASDAHLDVKTGATLIIENSCNAPSGFGTIKLKAKLSAGTSDVISLLVDDVKVKTWDLTNVYQTFEYAGLTGNKNIKIQYDDLAGDAQVDYIIINGKDTLQAENQLINSGAWGTKCGDGKYSETIACKGYIDFGARNFDDKVLMLSNIESSNYINNFSNIDVPTDCELEMYNLSGLLVSKKNIPKGISELKLELNPGMYIVIIKELGVRQKIIIN